MSTYSQGWSVCANINVHGQVSILPTSQRTIVNKKKRSKFLLSCCALRSRWLVSFTRNETRRRLWEGLTINVTFTLLKNLEWNQTMCFNISRVVHLWSNRRIPRRRYFQLSLSFDTKLVMKRKPWINDRRKILIQLGEALLIWRGSALLYGRLGWEFRLWNGFDSDAEPIMCQADHSLKIIDCLTFSLF